eukprot:4912708-Prymnesium_polylepis.1
MFSAEPARNSAIELCDTRLDALGVFVFGHAAAVSRHGRLRAHRARSENERPGRTGQRPGGSREGGEVWRNCGDPPSTCLRV